jgi:hypothetical protein
MWSFGLLSFQDFERIKQIAEIRAKARIAAKVRALREKRKGLDHGKHR